MAIDWSHAGPVVTAAFLASLVECLEALTVVLAVGAVRGWRGALGGAGLGLLVLLLLVLLLGPSLAAIPLDAVRIGVGSLLLLFGMRWLCKAVLRSAGVIAHRDEAAAYARETAALHALPAHTSSSGAGRGWDTVAVATAFKITMIEGIEVVFIVIAVGAAGRMLVPATLGAAAALALVALLGLALHRPVSAIPENLLKFAVGVLLCGFGTFWVGEGFNLPWPGQDWSLPALVAGFLAAALLAVGLCQRSVATTPAARPLGGSA